MVINVSSRKGVVPVDEWTDSSVHEVGRAAGEISGMSGVIRTPETWARYRASGLDGSDTALLANGEGVRAYDLPADFGQAAQVVAEGRNCPHCGYLVADGGPCRRPVCPGQAA